MARTIVLDRRTQSRVPFLRGILTRSLQAAGLPFDIAYRVASEVRDDLRGQDEVGNDDLRAAVVDCLASQDDVPDEISERYRNPTPVPEILVHLPDAPSAPYSRGRHRESLVACGIDADHADRMASLLLTRLVREGVAELDLAAVRHRTYDLLGEVLGDEAARQYLAWESFRHGDRPLILLIGGATGTGKSTLATRIAHRMDIVRTQSTDMLREVMRTMVTERLAPALHLSSFEAYHALPATGDRDHPDPADLVDGYLAQSELVSVAAEAIIRRATKERVSVVIEGVHLHPALHAELTARCATGSPDGPIVVSLILALLCPKELKRRIKGRGKKIPDRRAKRYLKHFDEIWAVQAFLLSEADRLHVPIVINDDIETAIDAVTEIVMSEFVQELDGDPEDVFKA